MNESKQKCDEIRILLKNLGSSRITLECVNEWFLKYYNIRVEIFNLMELVNEI